MVVDAVTPSLADKSPQFPEIASARGFVPLGWLALFEPDDLRSLPRRGGRATLTCFTTIARARENLARRAPMLADVPVPGSDHVFAPIFERFAEHFEQAIDQVWAEAIPSVLCDFWWAQGEHDRVYAVVEKLDWLRSSPRLAWYAALDPDPARARERAAMARSRAPRFLFTNDEPYPRSPPSGTPRSWQTTPGPTRTTTRVS